MMNGGAPVSPAARELPETGNVARMFWPLVIGGFAYSIAAARAQRGWAPLAFAGVAAYAVNKAMVNQRDYIQLSAPGLGFGQDVFPF